MVGEGRSEFFLPYEYSKMTSADYDGHENTLYTENHNNLGLNSRSLCKISNGRIS